MSEIEFIEKKNINEKNSKNFFINDNPNYSLDLYHIIEKINLNIDDPSQQKNNEYILNVLLMSSKLSNSNKIVCLLLLYYLYRKDERKKDLLNYLFFKICKLCQKLEVLEEDIIHKYLTFPESDDFVTSLEYISEIKKVINSDKNSNFKKLVENIEKKTNEKLTLYLEENISKFNSFNLMTDDQLRKIIEILIQLFSSTYEIKEDETPLFLIDKSWLFKMKNFLEPYIEARKENIANLLCEGAFNFQKVLEFIQSKEKFEILEHSVSVIFPGPINNLNLIGYGHQWHDPGLGTENFLMKNDAKINEDYFVLNKNDWYLLKSIFKDTNEIQRKNINDNICNFKVVIIEPRLAKPEYKYLLKKRYLQVNSNEDITELKNKIIRCLDYEIDKSNEYKNEKYYSNLYENNNVDFFVLDKRNKELLIELFISLVNNNKSYESLYIQQINLDDNINSINDLFNYFDIDSQILIAEVIPKNCFNFIKPIINRENSKTAYCSVCSEELNINEKYNCNLCNISFFCSYECAKISAEHINLHEALKQLYIKNFDLNKFFSEKMNLYKENPKDIMTFNKDKINNYSAINSIIHCLSNSTDLTKYFLSEKYLYDLNIADYLLNKKTFVSIYYNLINKIWYYRGKENLDFYYQNFLNTLLKKINYDPNDKNSLNNVLEILKFILTSFDKEINRANNLYNTKIDDLINKKNEISIITDLFKGIYQTTYSCTKCGNVSIIHDFFKYLLLPIPKKNNNLTIKYFTEEDCKYMPYTIDDNSDIKELKDKAVTEFLSQKINNIVRMMSITDLIEITAIDTDDEKILTEVAMYNSVELVLFDKNKMVNKIFLTEKKNASGENTEENNDENELKLQISKIFKENYDTELIFYERNLFEEPCINIYIYPFAYNEKEKMSTNKDKLYHTYPIAISVQLSLILENFEHYVNAKLRNLMLDYYKQESEKKNIDHIELVYPHYFGDSSFISSISSLYSSTTCFLCNEKTKNSLFCPLFSAIDKEKTIKDLMVKFDYPKQPIILLAKCKYYDTNKKYYSNMPAFYNKKDNKKQPENKLDLYNCFQLYLRKEILEGIDWHCEMCNSSQICEKQLSIYNLPVYLIIQIDRFAIKKTNSKNIVDNTLLHMPINNLNLNNYVEGPDKDKINYNYNLYAIIYKDISSRSDFTYCTCRNGNKWFLFKDNKVQIANELINKNVHFLFYKREDAQQ